MTLLAILLAGLALGHLAALVAVLFRYAIPCAPTPFRLVLFFPMLAISFSAASLCYMTLVGEDIEVLGLDGSALLVLYFSSEFVVWWTLNWYSVYYFVWKRRTTSYGARDDE